MAVFATGAARANYFQPGTGWGGDEIIDNQPNQPFGIQIALEPNGDGWAVWAQAPMGIPYFVYGNAFTPGGGWGGAGKVEDASTNSLEPQLAVDANGNALFIWYQSAGPDYQVWSNRWDESQGELTAPARVDAAVTAYAPVVASDPQGNGTAVWIQSTQVSGTPTQIAASRYTPGLGWSTPEMLAEGTITSDPRVAMDSQGNAVLAYTDGLVAWAHTYSEATWSPAVLLGGAAFQPSVAMDPNGNAIVVWSGGTNIWASTFE